MKFNTYRGQLAVQCSFWASALGVGIAATLFARFILFIQGIYAGFFDTHWLLASIWTPIAILAGAAVVRWFAPEAGGSGVPQVLIATHQAREESALREAESRLVSIRTALVKVLSTGLGFLGGASIGGEGPTVQI